MRLGVSPPQQWELGECLPYPSAFSALVRVRCGAHARHQSGADAVTPKANQKSTACTMLSGLNWAKTR